MSSKRGRHIPLRTCVVCGNKTEKKLLLRIVAPPGGAVETDTSGKAPGRGAYVCRNGSCAEERLGRSRIDSALRRRMSDSEWVAVRSSIEALITAR